MGSVLDFALFYLYTSLDVEVEAKLICPVTEDCFAEMRGQALSLLPRPGRSKMPDFSPPPTLTRRNAPCPKQDRNGKQAEIETRLSEDQTFSLSALTRNLAGLFQHRVSGGPKSGRFIEAQDCSTGSSMSTPFVSASKAPTASPSARSLWTGNSSE